jgi:hypothetical protein
MAGDWIKMRGNLWDDPRVAKLCDLTEQGEAAVIGGLYWLWATADQHSEDGIMPGLTLRQIDRKTGVPGLGNALVCIGWLADHPEGVRIVRFEEHNGTSAKRRAVTAKRVASHRSGNADATADDAAGNADVTQTALQDEHASVTGALAREREREEKNTSSLRSEVEPRKRSAPAQVSRPDDVAEQTWADWLALRKAKKAPVTETVLEQAKRESEKADMPLDAFLQVWCMRGSQGLQADWLKPAERQTASRQPMSYAQQDELARRARWEEMTGRKWPETGQPADADDYIDITPPQPKLRVAT